MDFLARTAHTILRRGAPPFENGWAAEGGSAAQSAASCIVLGRRRRLSGAKRRLLKIVEPPKAAQRREVPPFENGLADNGGVAARSAVFIKWFGSATFSKWIAWSAFDHDSNAVQKCFVENVDHLL